MTADLNQFIKPAAALPDPQGVLVSAAANFNSTLPSRPNRPRPHAYGTGVYGIGLYSPLDTTRYLWTRAAAIVLSLVLAMLAATPARAQNQYCENQDILTANFSLCKPSVDTEGQNAWGLKNNTNWDILDLAMFGVLTSTTLVRYNGTGVLSPTIVVSSIAVNSINNANQLAATLTVPASNLPAAVAYQNQANTFTSSQTIKKSLEVDGNTVFMGTAPWVDIRAFGAVADNATDNSVAIQNAINYCGTTGGSPNNNGCKVYVPPVASASGCFAYSTTLYVPSNIVVEGSGKFNSILCYNGTGAPTQANSYAIQLGTSTATLNYGLALRDIQIQINNKTGNAIHLYGTQGAIISNVMIQGVVQSFRTTVCAWVDGEAVSSFQNHIVNLDCHHTQSGVVFRTSGGVHATNTVIENLLVVGENPAVSTGTVGIDMGNNANGDDGSGTTIFGGDLEALTTGFLARPNGTSSSMYGTRFEANGTDIVLSTGATAFQFFGVQALSISSTPSNTASWWGLTGNTPSFTNSVSNLGVTYGVTSGTYTFAGSNMQLSGAPNVVSISSDGASIGYTLGVAGSNPRIAIADRNPGGGTYFLSAGDVAGDLDIEKAGTGSVINFHNSNVSLASGANMTVSGGGKFVGPLSGQYNVAFSSIATGGTFTTGSASYVIVTGSTVPITTIGSNFARVTFSGNCSNGTVSTANFAVWQDSVLKEPLGAGSGFIQSTNLDAAVKTCVQQYIATLSAGAHTFGIMAKVNGGTENVTGWNLIVEELKQ